MSENEPENAQPTETRTCKHCSNTFEYIPPPGKSGRRPDYCSPEHSAAAKKKRAGLAAAGMSEAGKIVQAAETPVLEAITELQGVLAGHASAIGEVTKVAIERAEAAEADSAEAEARAEEASARAETAERGRQRAEKERSVAVERKQTAERLARDAEREKEKAVDEAWRRVVDAEAKTAAAEAKAAEKTAAAVHANEQRAAAVKRAEEVDERNLQLQHDIGASQAYVVEAQAEANRANADAVAAAGQLAVTEARCTELQQRNEELLGDLARVKAWADATVEAAQQELVRVRADATAAAEQARNDAAGAAEQLAAAVERGQTAERGLAVAEERIATLQTKRSEWTWRQNTSIAVHDATGDRAEAERNVATAAAGNPDQDVQLVARQVTDWTDVDRDLSTRP